MSYHELAATETGTGVREQWLLRVAECVQSSLCRAALEGTEGTALSEALARLPLPGNRVEELVLSGLLLEASVGGRGMTASQLAQRVRQLGYIATPRRALSIAELAAAHITNDCTGGLNVSHLATSLGCDETALRRLFRCEFGISPREYHLRSRVQSALHQFAAGSFKIRAIAACVGYSSEKNFYRVVRRFTGRTPAELRALSGTDVTRLAASLLPRSTRATGLLPTLQPA